MLSPTRSFGLGLVCLALLLGITALSMCISHSSAASETKSELFASNDQTTGGTLQAAYGQIEMSFEANQGQTDPSVSYLARGGGYTLFLKSDEAVFALSRPTVDRSPTRGDLEPVRRLTTLSDEQKQRTPTRLKKQSVVRMQLIGADPAAAQTGVDELGGKVNYFIGNDQNKWHSDIPTYGRVRYTDVYQGVDVEFYGNQRQLEYDFTVKPGADPSEISLKFAGADSVGIDNETGDLLIGIDGQILRQHKPIVYQEFEGERRQVKSRYQIRSRGHVGFVVDEFDASRPLIIDPVLVYSTYLGGNVGDGGSGIAVDSSGNAYVTGNTGSTTFPTVNPSQSTNHGNGDIFVAKLSSDGRSLLYSTYIGGTGYDESFGIAVDLSGSAFVTGYTTSTDFPTSNAFQATKLGNYNAFVTKLDPSGAAFGYSTYLGHYSYGAGIAVDNSGSAYVTGKTGDEFPMVNPIRPTQAGGEYDAFLAKFNPAGNALVYSTYLGGSSEDVGLSVAVDTSGNSYVTGWTQSTNFPTANALQPTFAGTDAFVTKINPAGSAFVFSTFLGGSSGEVGYHIAADAAGNAYIVGTTDSTNFPTVGAIQSSRTLGPANTESFVTKINSTGSSITYSTYLGGSGEDYARNVAVDTDGNAYVSGYTNSANFPVANAIQTSNRGDYDAFLSKINETGSAFAYSTYFGGTRTEFGYGVAADASGSAYVTGMTTSTNLSTLFPYQGSLNGPQDAFVMKISDVAAPTPTPTPISPGGTDPSFGSDGKSIGSIPRAGLAYDIALQTDGMMVLATSVVGSDNKLHFAVARLLPEGSPDWSFGNGGLVEIPFDFAASEFVSAVALQQDGKIVVVGYVEYGSPGYDYGVARLNPDGSLDTTFGTGGKVKVPVGAADDYARDVAIQPDGKIVIVGKSRPSPNDDASIARLTDTGQLDTSFNGTGMRVIAIGPGFSHDEFTKVAIQSNGKIIAVGETSDGADGSGDQEFVTMRFNSNGSNDTTFGAGGKVITAVGEQSDHATAVAIQPDGKVLVGGTGNNGEGAFAALMRYNSNGSVDTSFGNSGMALTGVSPLTTFASYNTILIQSDGKIIGVGAGIDGHSSGDFMIARFTSTGSLDTEFGLNGIVHTKFDPRESAAYCAALQTQDGRLVVGGSSREQTLNGVAGITVVRYFLTPGVIVSGKVRLSAGGASISRAMVTMTAPDGTSQQTGTIGGNFFFPAAPNAIYTISVSNRQHHFAPKTVQVINDNVVVSDFVPN